MSETTKKVFYVIAGLTALFFFLKSENYSFCEQVSNDFRDNDQCDLILKKKEVGDGLVTLSGIDVNTGKDTTFVDGTKRFSFSFDSFLVGDTIIKNKGQYTITIRRKGKIIPFYYECEGHLYYDR